MGIQYKAHISSDETHVQTIKEHSENTAALCKEFAIPALKELLYVTGLLHDIGKYQQSFQKRINGENIRVEHSGCGAKEAEKIYAKDPIAVRLLMEYCIAGHHSGIPDGGYDPQGADRTTLAARKTTEFEDYGAYKEELAIPSISAEAVCRFLMQDCQSDKKGQELLIDKFAFITRYCFSCLTDADSLDTASFEGETTKPMTADFSACLEKVNKKLAQFSSEEKNLTPLQKARASLQSQVFKKCQTDAEIYLMNMPTGSGKTLCSIKFALTRAILQNKKRIIYVIPYNSIIDQTVAVFEEIFGESAQILRHQSTFSYEDCVSKTEDEKETASKAAENWNASVIVTTQVQFFESLYKNKRGKLRKLHNMADSILVFDEVHLLPVKYLGPCLRGVNYLTRYFNSEAVFLTATMPDFRSLIGQYALPDTKILDLIEDRSEFLAFSKCSYRYIDPVGEDELLTEAKENPSCLIIVNKKMTAQKLYNSCTGKKYHLSTFMTSLDRKDTISRIREELKTLEEDFPAGKDVPEERKIMIISTSLIEAGVDLDVFSVYRELSGLDSILQSGGRCNREGKRKNAVTTVFELTGEDGKTETKADAKTNIARRILRDFKDDPSCPEAIKEYYDALSAIDQEKMESHNIAKEEDVSGIAHIPFKKYAQDFNLIDSAYTESLLVPTDEKAERAVKKLRFAGASLNLTRSMQNYMCTVNKAQINDLAKQHAAENIDGIWCLTNTDYYDPNIGITFEARDYIL